MVASRPDPANDDALALDAHVEHHVRRLLAARAATSTICPSEVARALDAHAWRPLMAPVREALRRMARRDIVVLTRQGQPIASDSLHHAPLRVRRGARFNDDGNAPR